VVTGLDGTGRDSCLFCKRGTDSGLAFRGSAEWVIVALVKLGMMGEVASALVGEGAVTFPIRVCAECAAPLEVRPVALGVPVYDEG
jgi:hypothetical protein